MSEWRDAKLDPPGDGVMVWAAERSGGSWFVKLGVRDGELFWNGNERRFATPWSEYLLWVPFPPLPDDPEPAKGKL